VGEGCVRFLVISALVTGKMPPPRKLLKSTSSAESENEDRGQQMPGDSRGAERQQSVEDPFGEDVEMRSPPREEMDTADPFPQEEQPSSSRSPHKEEQCEKSPASVRSRKTEEGQASTEDSCDEPTPIKAIRKRTASSSISDCPQFQAATSSRSPQKPKPSTRIAERIALEIDLGSSGSSNDELGSPPTRSPRKRRSPMKGSPKTESRALKRSAEEDVSSCESLSESIFQDQTSRRPLEGSILRGSGREDLGAISAGSSSDDAGSTPRGRLELRSPARQGGARSTKSSTPSDSESERRTHSPDDSKMRPPPQPSETNVMHSAKRRKSISTDSPRRESSDLQPPTEASSGDERHRSSGVNLGPVTKSRSLLGSAEEVVESTFEQATKVRVLLEQYLWEKMHAPIPVPEWLRSDLTTIYDTCSDLMSGPGNEQASTTSDQPSQQSPDADQPSQGPPVPDEQPQQPPDTDQPSTGQDADRQGPKEPEVEVFFFTVPDGRELNSVVREMVERHMSGSLASTPATPVSSAQHGVRGNLSLPQLICSPRVRRRIYPLSALSGLIGHVPNFDFGSDPTIARSSSRPSPQHSAKVKFGRELSGSSKSGESDSARTASADRLNIEVVYLKPHTKSNLAMRRLNRIRETKSEEVLRDRPRPNRRAEKLKLDDRGSESSKSSESDPGRSASADRMRINVVDLTNFSARTRPTKSAETLRYSPKRALRGSTEVLMRDTAGDHDLPPRSQPAKYVEDSEHPSTSGYAHFQAVDASSEIRPSSCEGDAAVSTKEERPAPRPGESPPEPRHPTLLEHMQRIYQRFLEMSRKTAANFIEAVTEFLTSQLASLGQEESQRYLIIFRERMWLLVRGPDMDVWYAMNKEAESGPRLDQLEADMESDRESQAPGLRRDEHADSESQAAQPGSEREDSEPARSESATSGSTSQDCQSVDIILQGNLCKLVFATGPALIPRRDYYGQKPNEDSYDARSTTIDERDEVEAKEDNPKSSPEKDEDDENKDAKSSLKADVDDEEMDPKTPSEEDEGDENKDSKTPLQENSQDKGNPPSQSPPRG